ncbi:ricin B lectin domain-containing protein [Aspergillus californicus]
MASERLVDGVTYYIITLLPNADNRALEVYGGGELGNIGIWRNIQTTNRQWTAQRMTDGSWAFSYKRNPSAYLATNGKDKQLRVAVVDPNNDATARWKAEDLGDGYLFSNIQEANMAVDVMNEGTGDGTPCLLWGRHGRINQRWRISRVS